jgi:D-aminoacyl-tRNA deacylase
MISNRIDSVNVDLGWQTMRVVIQRVKTAAVTVDGEITGQIGKGLLILVGVARDDGPADVSYMANKIANLRVFPDQDKLLHFTTAEVGGGVLVVSQFTVLGDCRKGRRPSFDQSAPPELAEELYEELVTALAGTGLPVATGRFRAMMEVSLINDGPVTLLLDSKKLF